MGSVKSEKVCAVLAAPELLAQGAANDRRQRQRPYNLVIFGATGFTGKYLIQEIVKFLQVAPKCEKFTWAVAARSAAKLDKVLGEIEKTTGENLADVPKIFADVDNFDSLRQMAEQADIVLNSVGPYMLWGEIVVRACLAARTHHLDLSGELQFLEKIHMLYNNEAAEKNVFIVAPCGFGSVPADLGVIYLKEHFGGDLNSVEQYISVHATAGSISYSCGSFYSFIQFFHKFFELRKFRQGYPEPLPKRKYPLGQRWIHKDSRSGQWSIPLPFLDQAVVERSQRYFYHVEKERPIQIKTYFSLPSNFFYTSLLIILLVLVFLVSQFRLGRHLLETYPTICTLGFVTKDGPSVDEVERCTFKCALVGQGWSETLEEPSAQHATPPDTTKILEYHTTSPDHKNSKLCSRIHHNGGVYTPGIAFAKTSLVERLNRYGNGEAGVQFTLMSKSDLNKKSVVK